MTTESFSSQVKLGFVLSIVLAIAILASAQLTAPVGLFDPSTGAPINSGFAPTLANAPTTATTGLFNPAVNGPVGVVHPSAIPSTTAVNNNATIEPVATSAVVLPATATTTATTTTVDPNPTLTIPSTTGATILNPANGTSLLTAGPITAGPRPVLSAPGVATTQGQPELASFVTTTGTTGTTTSPILGWLLDPLGSLVGAVASPSAPNVVVSDTTYSGETNPGPVRTVEEMQADLLALSPTPTGVPVNPANAITTTTTTTEKELQNSESALVDPYVPVVAHETDDMAPEPIVGTVNDIDEGEEEEVPSNNSESVSSSDEFGGGVNAEGAGNHAVLISLPWPTIISLVIVNIVAYYCLFV